MSIAQPNKHHFIPECYLKSFANTQKQLWRRSKNKPQCTICTPGQVGYELGGNRIRTKEMLNLVQLDDANQIEKIAFRKQENNYPRILHKVVRFSETPLVIEKSDYYLFLKTLVTIKRRNPTTRKSITEAYLNSYNSEEAIPKFKAYLLEEAARENIVLEDNIESSIESYINSRASNPDWLYDMYLSAYVNPSEYEVIDDITTHLYSLKQHILHAPINSQFITSDNPGFTKANEKIISTGGFGGLFEFYFPLTPRACLYLNSSIQEGKNNIQKAIFPSLLSISKVWEINNYTKDIADKKLFGYDKFFLQKV